MQFGSNCIDTLRKPYAPEIDLIVTLKPGGRFFTLQTPYTHLRGTLDQSCGMLLGEFTKVANWNNCRLTPVKKASCTHA